MEFKKATLQEVSSQPSPTPKTVGEPVSVQVNPASLRLQMANSVDAGKAFARPNTQYLGSSSSTLAFDLVFDTADEGTTEEPVDVRTRTRQLEKFLLPSTASPKAVPPRVQFTYGTLTVVGVISALNQEFDLFALNGVPLRAKCAVTIKEQKPEFDANLAGPGANTGAGAGPPVPPGAVVAGGPAVPAAPGPVPDRTDAALDLESASDFAARMGLDPAAWKDVMSANGILDPLRLEAGTLLDFSASISVGAGIGLQAGATATVPQAPPPPPTTATPAQAPAAGTALTAAGGLSRAIDRSTVARTAQAAATTRDAFAGVVAPLRREAVTPGAPSVAGRSAPAPAAATVTADRRAATYGFGVPLRPRRAAPSVGSLGLVHQRVRGVRPAPADGIPETDDPTVPRWEALPPTAVSSRSGAAAPSLCSCGCGKAC